MSKVLFYTHTKEDLQRAVKMVIDEMIKTRTITNTPINPEEDRLTQKQTCQFLGISEPTIVSWKKKGIIPYYQIEDTIFYSKAELLELARKNPQLVKSSRR